MLMDSPPVVFVIDDEPVIASSLAAIHDDKCASAILPLRANDA